MNLSFLELAAVVCLIGNEEVVYLAVASFLTSIEVSLLGVKETLTVSPDLKSSSKLVRGSSEFSLNTEYIDFLFLVYVSLIVVLVEGCFVNCAPSSN